MLATIGTKYGKLDHAVSSLSGGNQQKVSFAKWIGMDLKIIILDEPTRGVDVGAKAEIYRIIDDLAKKGLGVVVVSSELPEIVGLCDRVYVMHEGTVAGHLTGSDISEENIVEYVMGVKHDEVA